jgi:ABC-2 type transport system permease protein
VGPLAALVRKELIQFFRSRPLIVLVVWTIAVEIAICAFSITYDVKHLGLAVQDLDGSPASRELMSRFARTESFDVAGVVTDRRALDALLERGGATVGLVVPADFSRRLEQRRPASVQLLVDGSESNSALIALGYAQRIVGRYSRELEVERLRVAVGIPGAIPGLEHERRAWYNPALRSVDFVVVSMLTLAVMMIAIILPAAGLAWEKEAGTIEQLLVMPFRRWELMLAKVIPTFVVSLGALALAFWVPWWFAVPIRGSVVLFFALSALFLVSALGLGLFLGTLAQNLQQALLLSFFTLFPVLVISGVVVPVESMPRPVQALALLSPLTYYLEIALGVLVKGVGLAALWREALAMGALGLAMFALGLWRFGRRIR